MEYGELFQEENESVKERYGLALERILTFHNDTRIREPFLDYFQRKLILFSKTHQTISTPHLRRHTLMTISSFLAVIALVIVITSGVMTAIGLTFTLVPFKGSDDIEKGEELMVSAITTFLSGVPFLLLSLAFKLGGM